MECLVEVPGVPGLQGKSYQSWIAAQPVNLTGLVLRSLVETSTAAYVGGIKQAIPHMLGQNGQPCICPQLQEVLGRVEGDSKY